MDNINNQMYKKEGVHNTNKLEIPKTKKLCQAERFAEGLRLLSLECGLESLDRNAFGIIGFNFEDGSSVGGLGVWKVAGIIK